MSEYRYLVVSDQPLDLVLVGGRPIIVPTLADDDIAIEERAKEAHGRTAAGSVYVYAVRLRHGARVINL